MRKLPFLLLAILLAAQDSSIIRVQVQLVTVLATVKNQRGGLVGSLAKEDFAILDEGRPQDLRIFERQAGMPLSVALLVDSSGSTAKDLKFELDSATRFLRTIIRPEDRACIFSFNQSVERIGDFISRDQPDRARSFVQSLIDRAKQAVEFPQSGRIVPEFCDESLREFIEGNYRIVYEIFEDRKTIVVMTVFEGHRLIAKNIRER